MHLFCIFFVCRLSVAYLSSVSQLSVILVGINFLSMFGLWAVGRLLNRPSVIYMYLCIWFVSSVSHLSLACLSSVRRLFIAPLSSTCTSVSGMCRLFLICL